MQLKTILGASLMSLATIALFSPESFAGKFSGKGDLFLDSPLADEELVADWGPKFPFGVGLDLPVRLPDLDIVDFRIVHDGAFVKIANIGDGHAPSCMLERLGSNGYAGAMIPLLAPGETVEVYLPELCRDRFCDTCWFYVDAMDRVVEWSESNNSATDRIGAGRCI